MSAMDVRYYLEHEPTFLDPEKPRSKVRENNWNSGSDVILFSEDISDNVIIAVYNQVKSIGVLGNFKTEDIEEYTQSFQNMLLGIGVRRIGGLIAGTETEVWMSGAASYELPLMSDLAAPAFLIQLRRSLVSLGIRGEIQEAWLNPAETISRLEFDPPTGSLACSIKESYSG
jgi:hypothetical protein